MNCLQSGKHFYYLTEPQCAEIIAACDKFLISRGINVEVVSRRDWGYSGKASYKDASKS